MTPPLEKSLIHLQHTTVVDSSVLIPTQFSKFWLRYWIWTRLKDYQWAYDNGLFVNVGPICLISQLFYSHFS